MITKLSIHNFKKLNDVSIGFSQPVVFIGPNNSGKTTALQAITLWETGYKKWMEKRGPDTSSTAKDRSGITINRNELNEIPLSETKLLWKDKHIFSKQEQIFIDIILEGVTAGKTWKCGFEFYFANDESIYCRPMRVSNAKNPERMIVPNTIGDLRVAFLQPMSGLSDREFLKQPGEIDFLLGQGQTAQVLRNLCFNVFKNYPHQWGYVVKHITYLFGAELQEPEFSERSEITIKYKDNQGAVLDLPSSGRGLQQTLLLLVYLYSNPHSILLLDEPDAHLEILRQRQIFNLICQIASEQDSQIIAASHSEVVLNEAASLGNVVAFIGKPFLLNERPSQVIKALSSIGWDQYALAEQKGWVLYLEDASDLAILQAFANKLHHKVSVVLQSPFVHYVTSNLPNKAREHFYGLQTAKKDLVGIALFDKIEQNPEEDGNLKFIMWKKREIENYLCIPSIFDRLAEKTSQETGPLFIESELKKRKDAMTRAISEVEAALRTLEKEPWSDDIKASDEFINLVLKKFSEFIQSPLVLRKNEYFKLVELMKVEEIAYEVTEKLDQIYSIAVQAIPADLS